MDFRPLTALFFLVLIIGFHSPDLLAQSFRVKKTKGRQAIIELTSGSLENNHTYIIDSSKAGLSSQSQRKRVLGLEGSLLGYSSLASSTDGAGSSSWETIALQSYFGWNFQQFEVGPIVSFVSTSGGVKTSSLGFGGFFDYNLQDNSPGREFLSGLLATFQLINQDAGGSKSNGQKMALGAFIKWFPGPDWLCLRTNLKYEMTDEKTSLTATKTTGFTLLAGFASYF